MKFSVCWSKDDDRIVYTEDETVPNANWQAYLEYRAPLAVLRAGLNEDEAKRLVKAWGYVPATRKVPA
jgi:hypothetical protein